MRLLHRTDWWGDTINWRQVPADEVDIKVIWTHALMKQRSPSCCPKFGERRVGVTLEDFTLCHDGRWSLYFVSGTEGENEDHFFQKLLLIPVGTPGYGKANCKTLGWTLVGFWNASNDTKSLSKLHDLLKPYETEDDHERCHLHIGIHMEELAAGEGHNDKKSLKQLKKSRIPRGKKAKKPDISSPEWTFTVDKKQDISNPEWTFTV